VGRRGSEPGARCTKKSQAISVTREIYVASCTLSATRLIVCCGMVPVDDLLKVNILGCFCSSTYLARPLLNGGTEFTYMIHDNSKVSGPHTTHVLSACGLKLELSLLAVGVHFSLGLKINTCLTCKIQTTYGCCTPLSSRDKPRNRNFP